MFEADNIRDWREHDVVDPDGSKIGQLEAVYVDTGTDLPVFASVKIGMIGRHRLTFVPLTGGDGGTLACAGRLSQENGQGRAHHRYRR